MSNRFTKYTADKLRADGWLDKEQADALRTRLQQVEIERDEAKVARDFAELACQRKEADAAVMRGAVELVIDAYSFVSGGSREPISTAMKRPENEMRVFRLVVSLNNLRKKCESTNAGKSLLERLKEAEWLLRESQRIDKEVRWDSDDLKLWATRRDTFLNPKPQDVM